MKIINFNSTETIKEVVRDFTNFIAKTYGPAGKSILLSDNRAVDDGKLVARDYELENEAQNAVISYIQEATEKTDNRVGDGTTTSAIIMGAIVEEVLGKETNEFLRVNTYGEIAKLEKGLEEAVKHIKKQAKPIKTQEELYAIAFNSYNDKEIASLISETLFKIGKNGVLSVEDSPTAKTECEVVEGLELEKGYVSPYLVNEGEKVVLKNPWIILVNGKVVSVKTLAPIIQQIAQSTTRELVIIAENFSDEVTTTFILNKIQGNLKPLLIENPSFGENRLELLKDISSVVGGKIVDEKAGISLDKLTLQDLGTCTTITAKKDTTTITAGKKGTNLRVKELKEQFDKATNDFDKDKILRRIAALEGGVAVLKVGANTENEQRTKKLKAEDAINATRIAYKDGIVKGGGKTFLEIKTSSESLNKALEAPRKRLEENGKEFLDDKVYDPAGVLIAALESAVSIACGLIKMGGIIAIKREKRDKPEF